MTDQQAYPPVTMDTDGNPKIVEQYTEVSTSIAANLTRMLSLAADPVFARAGVNCGHCIDITLAHALADVLACVLANFEEGEPGHRARLRAEVILHMDANVSYYEKLVARQAALDAAESPVAEIIPINTKPM